MTEITIAVRKFQQLFDYLQRLELDVDAIAAAVDLSAARISRMGEEELLPARHYSVLYREAVRNMQTLKQPLPWAAGVGSEAFELMCYCMISGRTLGEALDLAVRYEYMLYPMIGHRVELRREGDDAVLGYRIRFTERGSALAPADWDKADSQDTVAKASGLVIWHLLCGWLTGESLCTRSVNVAAPYLNQAYARSLERTFGLPPEFDARENCFTFSQQELDCSG